MILSIVLLGNIYLGLGGVAFSKKSFPRAPCRFRPWTCNDSSSYEIRVTSKL